MPNPAILLVEDDVNDVDVAVRALRRHGLEDRVKVVRDGAEALDYLHGADAAPERENGLPCVVLLDLKMPRVDGWEVLAAIRSDDRTSELPVVVLSSSERSEDVRRSYRMGANSFVPKRADPVAPGEYLAAIARYWLELNRRAP